MQLFVCFIYWEYYLCKANKLHFTNSKLKFSLCVYNLFLRGM